MSTETHPLGQPEAPAPQGPTILLVDLSSIAYPIWHTSQSEPDPNTTSTRIVSRVRSLATGHPHAAICVDSGRSFRAEIDPSYKANRPEAEATLHHQIALAVDTLRADGFPIWAVKGYEADDLIATGVARAMEREGCSVVIASADKDLLQLVNPRVRATLPKDGSLVDEDGVVTKMGVLPFQIRDYLSLCGDASDNIKGASRIGPKIAAKLLLKHGSLDTLYAALDANAAGEIPAGVKASLAEFRPRLATVRALVSLKTDAPIAFEEVFQERVPKDIDLFSFDGEEDGMEPEPAEPTVTAMAPTEPASEATKVATATNGNGNHEPAAIAVRADLVEAAPVEWEKQLEPRSMKDAQVLAKHMYDSRLFSEYGSPPAVLSILLAGRELGMQAMAALRAFHVIEGKPRLAADLIRAMVIKSGKAKYFRCIERTNERATFETQRGDDPPMSLTYTVQEGRAAFAGTDEKWKNSGWGRNPADMCVARAGSKLARLVFPDVVHGLISSEEID